MTPSAVQRVSAKRKRSPSKGEALRLVLEPPSVPAKRRRLGDRPGVRRLQVDDNNRVDGSVNGHTCKVQLDSGAQVTFLFFNMAKRLGLISGTEPTTKKPFDLWIGPRVLDVVELKAVTIRLGSDVEVVTPATVFPEYVEDMYDDAEDVVLDAHQLRRGGMVQVFGPGGSELFVCRPEHLQRKVRKTERGVEPDVLWVRPEHGRAGAKPWSVLVDTAATGIHVSQRRRRLLLQSRKGRRLPKRVVLDLGDGCCLNAEPLEDVESNDHDFIIGISLLCKYGAVLDHARHTLYFPVDSQWRKTSTQTLH